LFAKKNNGTFIIRIEDTDQTRFVPGAQDYIMDALKWCGINATEGPGIGGEYGPYVQSERNDMYRPYAEQLVANDKAYYAFDTPEELEEMREKAKLMNMPNWQYNSVTRTSMKNSISLPADEVKRRIENGDPYVIRIKMPRNVDVRFEDMIRGWVTVNTNNLDDKVLFKSDGIPTYHLANIVDDHTMEISHVIRGEEWLPSAPMHIMLYEAFGWEPPRFAHLPLLLRPDGNGKLSKRDGDRLGFPVFPCDWVTAEGELYSGYREKGYLPQAFINMLAFLGWNPGTTQEIFSMEELEAIFTLERVSKGGAKFDPDKTKWFQHQHLKAVPDAELADLLIAQYDAKVDKSRLTQIVHLMKERATFPQDILTEGAYLMERPTSIDAQSIEKKWKDDSNDLLTGWLAQLEVISDFTAPSIENVFKAYIAEKNVGIGAVMFLFRLLVTGQGAGPSMFEISEFLGKQEVIDRLNWGLATVAEMKK